SGDHKGEGDDAGHAPGDVECGDGDLPEGLGLREGLVARGKDGVPAEEDDPSDQAGNGNHDRRQEHEDAGDDELREEQAAARDGTDEQVAEAAPVGLLGDGRASEDSDDDDQEEAACGRQGGERDVEAGGSRDGEEGLLLWIVWTAAKLDGERDKHGDEGHDPERDVGAQAGELLDKLDADQVSSSATRPMKASSSRLRASTVSTPTPAWTSAATISLRGVPLSWSEMPGGCGSTPVIPGSA